MHGLMQDAPLLISGLLSYAQKFHPTREVVSRLSDGSIHRYTYAQAGDRAARLASALLALGVKPGDRIATLAMNGYRHFELFYGVSGIGAILHTVNPKLFEEQIAYIIDHAQDSLIFLDAAFAPLLSRLWPKVSGVRQVFILGDKQQTDEAKQFLEGAQCYEELLEQYEPIAAWPVFDERTASSLCYTSGTTGNPKGVLYSHRSTVIHAMAACQNSAMGISSFDVIMPIAPLYHGNGWSAPYLAPMAGAKLVLPGPQIDGPTLHGLIDGEGVTFTIGVPTVFTMLLEHLEKTGTRIDTLKKATIGGSSVPDAMIETLAGYGCEVRQVWGMTETSPLGTMTTMTPRVVELGQEQVRVQSLKQGRAQFGIELKIKDEQGCELPRDGTSSGSLWVRGPWAASGYYRGEGGELLDEQGFFPTGDVACLDELGFLKITDRVKDVIKSGGEWISSSDIENRCYMHPKVKMAAMVGVRHPRWDERPLLFIVPKDGQSLTKEEVLDFLRPHVAKWWLPDDVLFVEQLPMTATGKIRKATLRENYADHLASSQTAEAVNGASS